MNRNAILCYTTTISVERTVAEIQRLLAAAKAAAILSEFDNGRAARAKLAKLVRLLSS